MEFIPDRGTRGSFPLPGTGPPDGLGLGNLFFNLPPPLEISQNSIHLFDFFRHIKYPTLRAHARVKCPPALHDETGPMSPKPLANHPLRIPKFAHSHGRLTSQAVPGLRQGQAKGGPVALEEPLRACGKDEPDMAVARRWERSRCNRPPPRHYPRRPDKKPKYNSADRCPPRPRSSCTNAAGTGHARTP
ncbi:hypothetical protein SAMN05421830_103181 [Desulfomicrobium norvegicum]|uniref:Uncharacterized protein n=1 Tax=Desulfomicrobium norvegicum (strain DSM 1741 / NCIMB 8310) TaxID=52561 RepID=A0A8G2FDQ6_DESNO|nr:hypothetical protein SAMN05421830_103181 [Desulfomicrobium norvegicum]